MSLGLTLTGSCGEKGVHPVHRAPPPFPSVYISIVDYQDRVISRPPLHTAQYGYSVAQVRSTAEPSLEID